MLRKMLKKLGIMLYHIWPKQCLNCHRFGVAGKDICHECADLVTFGVAPRTAACADQPLTLNLPGKVYIDGYEIVTSFQPPISILIKTMKYQNVKSVAKLLGEWLWWWGRVPWKIDVVCHVPLHPRRFAVRGFNQAQVMAATYASLASCAHWPLLVRQQHTTNQAAVALAQRQTQLAGIFGLSERFSVEKVRALLRGKNILIIDDVMTSGHTFNECARALKLQAEAAHVYALAFSGKQN